MKGNNEKLKKNKDIHIRVDEVDVNLLDKLCTRTGKSKTDVIRNALKFYDKASVPTSEYSEF